MNTPALVFSLASLLCAKQQPPPRELVLRPGYAKASAGPLTVFLTPDGSLAIRRGPKLLGQGGVRTSNNWGHWQPLWFRRPATHEVTERSARFRSAMYLETFTVRDDGTLHVAFEITPGDREPDIVGVGFEMPTAPFAGTSLSGDPEIPATSVPEKPGRRAVLDRQLKRLVCGAGSDNQVTFTLDEPYRVEVTDQRIAGQDVLLVVIHATPTKIGGKPGGKVGFTVGP